MQRSKIIVGSVIFGFMLIILTISFSGSDIEEESKDIATLNKPVHSAIDQQAVQLYKWQQAELRTAITAYFDKALASGDIVGAGVSIVKGDSIILSDGFGKRNAYKQETVNAQTVFRLGSLSKGFAGILAADLASEGQLEWDNKVSDCLPEFQLGDKKNTEAITLSNILSHTSGAPYHSYTDLVEAGLPMTDIAWRFKYVTPISSPGELYSYQNALFALSGEMIYQCTGQEITVSLADRFFNPLEMCSTTMDHESLVAIENVAIPHTKRRRGWRPGRLTNSYYNAVAAGGINANAVDMAKWMQLLLGHHPEIMTKSDIAEAFTPIIKIPGRSKYYQRWPGHVSSHYGYGWRIHKFVEDSSNEEKTIWHHGGSVNNFRNEIALFPESDLGICVLLNNNSRLAKKVVPDLYSIVQKIYEKSASKMALSNGLNKMETLTTAAQFQ